MTRTNDPNRRAREMRPAETNKRIRQELLKISNREREAARKRDLQRARRSVEERRAVRDGIGGPSALHERGVARVNTTAPAPPKPGDGAGTLPPMAPGVDPGAPKDPGAAE